MPNRPTLDQAVALGLACAENALAYLEDIDALEARERHVRAFALAGLAMEEASKALVCAYLDDEDGPAWETYDLLFRDRYKHVNKLTFLGFVERLKDVENLGVTEEQVASVSHAVALGLFDQRMAALYVDLEEDGNVRTPRAMANDETLRSLTAELRKIVVSYAIIAQAMLRKMRDSREG